MVSIMGTQSPASHVVTYKAWSDPGCVNAFCLPQL